jgi:quercetin dioxygenase-like cupin family protein
MDIGVNRAIVVDRNQQTRHSRTPWGEQSRICLGSAETQGAFSILDYRAPAGFGVPRHTHHREDEVLHVISGQSVVWTPEHSSIIGPGDTILLPKGIPHAWQSYGDQPVHFAVTVAPSGFESYFPGIIDRNFVLSDIDGLTKLLAELGIDVFGPPLSDREVAAILEESIVQLTHRSGWGPSGPVGPRTSRRA